MHLNLKLPVRGSILIPDGELRLSEAAANRYHIDESMLPLKAYTVRYPSISYTNVMILSITSIRGEENLMSGKDAIRIGINKICDEVICSVDTELGENYDIYKHLEKILANKGGGKDARV